MKEQEKKHFPVLPVLLGVLLVLVLAVYGGGIYYYQSHFVNGTVINMVDVSGMTVPELEEQAQEYLLRIVEKKTDGSTLEEDIQGREIGLSYSSTEPLTQILKKQNCWLWFLQQHSSYNTADLLTYDDAKLKEKINGLSGFEDSFAQAPTDAYISEYQEGSGFEIVPETQGNQLDPQKTEEAIRAAVDSLEDKIDLAEADCYKTPEITSEDAQLQATLANLQKYAQLTITYQFGDQTEVLDGATISSWLQVDGTEVTLDDTEVEDYVATLRKKYDTIFRSRTFQTTSGKEITISEGDYGWWMNYKQEAQELAEMIRNGESGERTPVYYQTAASYGTPDYGNTYVEVNLTAQHLYFYKEGELILESDFVSGNSSKGYDTPAGVYGITYKQRNATLVGENYSTPVSYWMPFNNNIGLHDASWRSSFGGSIYKTSGSHGCINLPPAKAQELYGYIEKGTPVICYYMPGTEPKEKETEQTTTETDTTETDTTENTSEPSSDAIDSAASEAAAEETAAEETAE